MDTPNHANHPLSVLRVGEIPKEESPRRWLIQDLWGASSVGCIAGCPKVGKSWLGLEMAVSVATGKPCLGTYPVTDPGPVLAFLAEDRLSVLRERVENLARHKGVDINEMKLNIITEPTLHLDRAGDRMRLMATASALRPRLVLLDPLVRIHSANENDATEISKLLSYFRELQRRNDTSVILVHHTRKTLAGSGGEGQNLRGSSDIWAFGDSNLYLRPFKGHVLLTMEHRAAAAPDPVCLHLVAGDAETVHLEVTNEPTSEKAQRHQELKEAILDALTESDGLTRDALRLKLSVKNARLGKALEELQSQGRLERGPQGWRRITGTN